MCYTMTTQTATILKQIVAADRKVEGWIATRTRLIVEAKKSGAGLREIATACNLSHMSIKRIINKQNTP